MDNGELLATVRLIGGDDVSAALSATARATSELERTTAVLVRRARNEGASWAQIAVALGVSKQAVHKKYAGAGLFGSRP